jgi:predicted NAD-dependent protein-ADP-ribosyltransferase YbiA (DUF1768 family)
MGVLKEPTLWDYLPINSKVQPTFETKSSFPEQTHKLCVPLDIETNELITTLLDKLFHLKFDEFLSLFDIISNFQDLLLSIPVHKRKPLLYTLLNISSKVEFLNHFFLYIEFLMANVVIIDFIKINNNARTLRNLLRSNGKVIQTFFDHINDYRPQVNVEKGQEQGIYEYIPGAGTVENLNQCFSSIEDAAVDVKIAINETTAILHSMAPKIEGASDSITAFSQFVPHLIETLNSITKFTNAGHQTLGKLEKHTDKIASVDTLSSKVKQNWPAIIACITGITTSESMVQLLTHVVPLLAILGLDTGLISYLSDFFSKKPTEQGDFANTKKLMIFLASFLGKYSPILFVAKFTTTLSSTSKDMESLDKLADIIGDVLSEFGFDITSKAKAITELRNGMIELIEKTPKFEALVATKCVAFVRDENFKDFMICYNKIQEIKKQVDTGVYMSIRTTNFCADLMQFNTRYIRMKAAIDYVRATNGRRQEPVAFLFHGLPKLGKSQLMCQIKSRIGKIYKKEYADKDDYLFMDDFDDWTTWQQNTTDDFHQGYNGQEIHAVDDLFSRVDHLDHKDMLNFISCVVFPTRQAELSEKGKPYVSKLLLASSNIWPTSSTTINCVDALHRRFTVIRFTKIAGQDVPKSGFDNDFKWLDLSESEGEMYSSKSNVRKQVSIDEICRHIIEAMRIKHDIFQAGLAAAESGSDDYIPRITTLPVPSTLTKVFLEQDWTASCTKNRQNTDIYRFMRKIKVKNPCVPSDDGLYSIADLAAHNNIYNDTKTILFCLTQSNFNDLGFALLVKDIDGSYMYFNTLTKTLHRSFEDYDSNYTNTDVELVDDFSDFCFTDKMQRYFLNFYRLVYDSFGSFINVASLAGNAVAAYMAPVSTLIMGFVSVIVVKLGLTDGVSDFNSMVFKMINDIYNISYLIPVILGVGAFIIYKCKTFVMIDACTNCACSVENFSDIKAHFHDQHCNLMTPGDHQLVCAEFEKFGTYYLKDYCGACANNACDGDCSHSLPPDAIDPKKLTYYKNWFLKYVQTESVVVPIVLRNADTILTFVEEESPKGERMSLVKRKLPIYEESPKGERQSITKRRLPILEESPKGERMVKSKRTLRQEEASSIAFKYNTEHRFLSNFSLCPMKEVSIPLVGSVIPLSVEHAYQASLTDTREHALKILAAHNAFAAKAEARKHCRCNNSDELRLPLMRKILDAKFYSGSKAYQSLKATEDAYLYEKDDVFWGLYRDRGTNHLGQMLMEIRDADPVNEIAEWLSQPNKLIEEYDFGGHNPGSEKQEKLKISRITSGAEQQALDCGSRDLFSAVVQSTLRCKRSVGSRAYTLHGHPFGKYIVTPAHLHTSSDINAIYSFETIVNGLQIEVPMTLVAKRENRDVAVWEFVDKRVLFSQRFYNNLITDEEYIKFANERLYVLQHLPMLGLCQLVTASSVNHKQICLANTGVKLYEKLYEVQATSTLAPITSAGDCGGVLVAFNTLVKKKIIGFHVVGANDRAYSAILTKDLIDSMIPIVAREEFSDQIIDQKFSKFPIVDTMNQIHDTMTPSSNMPNGNFEYLGELTFLARPAASTGIKKHPLYGSFEVKHAPANLSTNTVEDKSTLRLDAYGEPNLLITRTEKYGKTFKNVIDPEILESMESDLSHYYIDQFEGKNVGISSDYDILNGNPLDTDSHPLDMRTSAGIPWSKTQQGHAHKKEHFIKYQQDSDGNTYREFDLQNPDTVELLQSVAETERLALLGYRTLSINKDCLKDECRPLGKVDKPRIFKNVPFDKVILNKRYLGKFKTEWTKMQGTMFHSVGINTVSPAWAHLYHEMKEKSDLGCDADFGTFDGNLRPEFMDIASRIIRNTISSQNGNDREIDKIIEVLLDENVRSVSVSAYTVYMDEHGNPSGSPMTTVMNCMVNFLYHWYCFIKITGYRGLNKFLDSVVIRAFGDDVIYTADLALGYNFSNVSKIMIDDLEQDYTDATKSLDGATKPIEELSFLKRKFKVISQSIVLCPIETDSIEMRFNWTNISPNDIMTQKDLIEEGLLEAVMHGTEYFNAFAAALQRGIRNCHLKQDIRSFRPKYSDYYQDLMNRYQ